VLKHLQQVLEPMYSVCSRQHFVENYIWLYAEKTETYALHLTCTTRMLN